jgi:hypothetical protein
MQFAIRCQPRFCLAYDRRITYFTVFGDFLLQNLMQLLMHSASSLHSRKHRILLTADKQSPCVHPGYTATHIIICVIKYYFHLTALGLSETHTTL